MEFRKRLTDEVLAEINEMIIDHTLILDAICAPQNIEFLQDINIYRNRVNLSYCKEHGIRLSALHLAD